MRVLRFDLVEVLVIATVIGTASFALGDLLRPFARGDVVALGNWGASELAPLKEKYGPDRFSRNAEEWIIRDFFGDRRNGVFLDVGAHHYRDENNTYFLESQLGWRGIAIDAQEEFARDYTAHRPRTTFIAGFVSNVAGGSTVLHVPSSNTLVASETKEFSKNETGTEPTSRSVPTITLDQVLADEGIERLDFMSMDIELSEPRALAGFSVDRYRPALVCIEGHQLVRQAILDYFHAHDYVLIGKYLRMDSLNLYFRPASH
jgi:FkbM family methyltransferase